MALGILLIFRRMPLTCVSNDAILKKPENLNYSNASKSSPFTLNGAPFANNPESIKDKQETVTFTIPGTPGKVSTATSPAVAPTAETIGYRTENIKTENIIGENGATTLKYENKTYKQKFIAVHQGFWGNLRPHVSILLLSPENDFFHICIPITLTDGDQDTNLFLKYWLKGGALPSGFTLNHIMNFRGQNVNNVEFGIIQYCLKYNSGANINPYTLCIFKTPLLLNGANIPWITDFRKVSKPTFDKILNYMLNGMFKNNNSRIVSDEEHFSSSSVTTPIPTASHYIVKSSELMGKSFGLVSSKKLNNIKCYPIDLFNQIDDEGNIFIDEDSKKPIDVKSVNDPNGDIPKDSFAELDRQKSLNNVSFIIVFSIVFGVICIIIIVLAVWFFSGKPADSATVASAVAAAAVGNIANNSKEINPFSMNGDNSAKNDTGKNPFPKGQNTKIENPFLKGQNTDTTNPFPKVQNTKNENPFLKGQNTKIENPFPKGQKSDIKTPFTKAEKTDIKNPFLKGQNTEIENPFPNAQNTENENPFLKGQNTKIENPFPKGQKSDTKTPFTKAQKTDIKNPFSKGQKTDLNNPFSQGENTNITTPFANGQNSEIANPFSKGQNSNIKSLSANEQKAANIAKTVNNSINAGTTSTNYPGINPFNKPALIKAETLKRSSVNSSTAPTVNPFASSSPSGASPASPSGASPASRLPQLFRREPRVAPAPAAPAPVAPAPAPVAPAPGANPFK